MADLSTQRREERETPCIKRGQIGFLMNKLNNVEATYGEEEEEF